MLLKELALKTKGKVFGSENLDITKVAEVENADAKSLIFINNKNQLALIKGKKPLCIVSSLELEIDKNESSFLKVDNLRIAMAIILKELEPQKENSISEKCKIAKTAKLGKNVAIGDFVYIGENVSIGDNTVINASVSVYDNCLIGSNVLIHSGAVIGADGFGFVRDEQNKLLKIAQIGNVIIKDFVEIGANTTIDRATIGSTIIGENTKLDNLVHIGHNCKIGKDCVIAASCAFGGSCLVEDFVTMAGFCAVADHIKIGEGAIIAGRSGITKEVPPKAIFSGYPARDHLLERKFWASLNRIVKKKENK